MILPDEVVDHFAALVLEAEEATIEEIKSQELQQEPAITDRFIDKVKTLFNERGSVQNISLRAYTLADRGWASAEKKYGADLCGVIDIKLRGFAQTKGFLWQAKRENSWLSVNTTSRMDGRASFSLHASNTEDFKDLQRQARDMLAITPDSFAIVYSEKGFVVTPASTVTGLFGSDEIHVIHVSRFFRAFLRCYIGDTKLTAGDPESLERLRKEYNARSAVLFTVTGDGELPPSKRPPDMWTMYMMQQASQRKVVVATA